MAKIKKSSKKPSNIIEIPDNLSLEQEAALVAKSLLKNPRLLLSGSTTDLKGYIGDDGVRVQELNTSLKIHRVTKEKPVITLVCSVCESVYEKQLGRVLFTNYGGNRRSVRFCSDACCDVALSLIPNDRLSRNRKKLNLVKFF